MDFTELSPQPRRRRHKLQTYTKKRQLSTPIFEDTYQPTQKIQSVPQHQTSNPMTPISTLSVKWRQQTLTQLTPSLSSPRSEEDLGDLDYEKWPRKRYPLKRSKGSAKQRLDQQTITQMDPFRQQLYPKKDIENLLEEPLMGTDHVPKKKKRRLEPEQSVNPSLQSKSAKRRGRKDVVTHIQIENSHPTADDQLANVTMRSSSNGPEDQQSLMPPPVTPKTTRKKEIPSSQTPDDTPYTNRSVRSRRENDVSPLKERSVNTPSRNFLAWGRDFDWTLKLEVANSTDLSSENASIATSMAAPLRPTGSQCLPQDSTNNSIHTRYVTSSFQTPILRFEPSEGSSNSGSIQLRSSLDSGQLIQNDETKCQDSFCGCPQGGWTGINGADITDLRSTHPLNQEGTAQESLAAADLSIVDDRQGGNTYHTIPTQLLNHRAGELSFEYAFDESTERNSSPPKRDATALYQEQPRCRRSKSEETSLQLHDERLQPSEAPTYELTTTLETESQFESAWRHYTPQEDEDDIKAEPPNTSIRSTQDPSSQSEHEEIHAKPPSRAFQTTTQTTSSTSPHIPFNEDHQIAPVPPSQATTTDASESSPRPFLAPFLSTEDPPFHNDSNNNNNNLASSPTTDQSSISLFHTRQDSGASVFLGWNGVRTTDSELYPPGLMDETVPEPPAWREESVELLEEGEEEEEGGG